MYNLFMRQEERLRAEVRKWGHSLGLVIPATSVKKLKLREHEILDIKIKKRGKREDLMDLFGIVKWGEPTKKIIKEIKEGWGD